MSLRNLAGKPRDLQQRGQKTPRRRREKTEVNLERLLKTAAALMAKRGYEQTSIRDVARETGFSLAGMYYYFQSKEDLLYQIQYRVFKTLLDEQRAICNGVQDPDEKLRLLIENHLSYLTSHANELKVCTFELESLEGPRYREVESLRRSYYKLLVTLMGEVGGTVERDEAGQRPARHHTLFLFGMLNWAFTWFDPRQDGPTADLGARMTEFVLRGIGRQAGTDGDGSG